MPEVHDLFKIVGEDGNGEEALELMSRFVGDTDGSMGENFGALGPVTVFSADPREISVFTREKDDLIAFFTIALQKANDEFMPFLYTEILRTPKEEFAPTADVFKEAFEEAFKVKFTTESRAAGTVSSFRVEPATREAREREKEPPAASFISLDSLK